MPSSLIDWYEDFDKIYCPPLQGVRWNQLTILIWYYQITSRHFSERWQHVTRGHENTCESAQKHISVLRATR